MQVSSSQGHVTYLGWSSMPEGGKSLRQAGWMGHSKLLRPDCRLPVLGRILALGLSFFTCKWGQWSVHVPPAWWSARVPETAPCSDCSPMHRWQGAASGARPACLFTGFSSS